MRLIAAIVALCVCACYSPHYSDCLVSCEQSQACPSGLACDGMYCRDGTNPQDCLAVLGDAALANDGAGADIGTADDRDGDGRPNASDNCPDNPNPVQEDEDGDGTGDVCDKCPPFELYAVSGNFEDADKDTDGDGVGDGCDPDPMQGGDHIVLFAGFRLQPPAPAMVSTLGQSTIMFNGSATANTSTNSDVVTVSWPAPPESQTREVTAQLALLAANGPAGTGGGTIDRAISGSNVGMSCALWGASQTTKLVALVMLPNTVINMSPGLTPTSTFVIKERHNGGTNFFSCSYTELMGSGAVGALNNAGAMQANMPPASPVVGIRAAGTSVRFDWVMVVD